MAHYPLYTQNLSLVGVCVKRIGKVDPFTFIKPLQVTHYNHSGRIGCIIPIATCFN